MAPADVVYATFQAARPVPKKKYFIVVRPGLGLLINTERGFLPEADVTATPAEVGGCLSYTSFVRTGELFGFSLGGSRGEGENAGHSWREDRRRHCRPWSDAPAAR